MDKDKRDAIVQEDELFGFLNQKNISAKNIKRLEVLKLSTNSRIAELADIVYEIAKIKPRKRRRLKFLGKTRKDLLGKLIETGLIHAHHRW